MSLFIRPARLSVAVLYAAGRTRIPVGVVIILRAMSEFHTEFGSSYDDGGVSSWPIRTSVVPTCVGTNGRIPGFLVIGASKITVLESDSASALLSEDPSDRDLASFPIGLVLTLTLALGVFDSLAPGIGFEGVLGGNEISSLSVACLRMVMAGG